MNLKILINIDQTHPKNAFYLSKVYNIPVKIGLYYKDKAYEFENEEFQIFSSVIFEIFNFK